MKIVYFLGCFIFLGLNAKAQTQNQLQQLKQARQFLATTDFVYPYIDSAPAYEGGDEAWRKYILGSGILKNALEKAKDSGIQAGTYTVIVKFAVRPNGKVSDVSTVNKPVGYGFEEAAVKLVKKSGKWIPANVEGEDSKGWIKLPVYFTIDSRIN